MKSITFQNILPLFLIFLLSTTKSQQVAAQTTTPLAATLTNENLDGAWKTVWSKTNGVVDKRQTPMEFKMYHNGYFSLVMRDSTGQWKIASAGTYTLEGNQYIETHQYSTEPDWIGSTYWQQYDIKGDTLYSKLFTKVTDSTGKDVTAQYPTIEEKRVRAKQ